MSLTTPEKIRSLQRALYTKAKQEPEFRFYSLYDKVSRWDILVHAWRLCRANRGKAGVDRVTFADIEKSGVKEWLQVLQEEVRTEQYKPAPVRRVLIPKPGGDGQRPLGIPTIRDRVCQMAAKLVLEPIFEATFDDAAYGYRPRRSAVDAVEKVHSTIRKGHVHVVDADLSKYFDTIPHLALLKCLSRRISDGRMLHLIKMWLKTPVEETDERGQKRLVGGKGSMCGTPQGGVISPLLSNIYMHRFIKAFRKHELGKKYGAELVTYADDFVILCRANAQPVHDRVAQWMTQIGLTLNPQKTRVLKVWESSFNFLGYTFGQGYTAGTGKKHLSVGPSRKAIERFRVSIGKKLRRGDPKPMAEIVTKLNRTIRGWGRYFCFGRVGPTRYALDNYVTERVRAFLRKRHKTASRGARRFSYNVIRNQLGVLSLTALPRRQTAHASV